MDSIKNHCMSLPVHQSLIEFLESSHLHYMLYGILFEIAF